MKKILGIILLFTALFITSCDASSEANIEYPSLDNTTEQEDNTNETPSQDGDSNDTTETDDSNNTNQDETEEDPSKAPDYSDDIIWNGVIH